jgi:hypothetical protein
MYAAVLMPLPVANATYSLDRWYRMGDDPAEPAVPGQPVGTDAIGGLTYDSVGASGQSNFQDLTPVGSPVYVNISADQPFPNSTLDNRAIQFDGSTQYLFGHFLNNPAEADVSTGQVEDYSGITDRGYQLWFNPSVASTGADQSILDDANTHRALVGANGSFGFEIRASVQIGSTMAVSNQWAHVAQVRPNGNSGGSFGWVNGRIVASQTGDYASSTLNLAIGADVESDGLGGNVYTPSLNGLVSDVEMFVLGGSFGTFDYTTDNGYFTDVFLPSTSGYGYSDGDQDGHNDVAWIDGDINFDGALNAGDITTFIDGWLSTNAGTFVGGGPPVGDYVTLGLGDLNLDGVTDVDDWVALRATGVTAGSGGLASLLGPQIPEPASVVLALVTAIGITIGSRRGRRL